MIKVGNLKRVPLVTANWSLRWSVPDSVTLGNGIRYVVYSRYAVVLKRVPLLTATWSLRWSVWPLWIGLSFLSVGILEVELWMSIREGLSYPSPTHMTFSPKASPVWASVSPLSHPPKSHARFSFGVKLNLTNNFLLESEIQSPLHFWNDSFLQTQFGPKASETISQRRFLPKLFIYVKERFFL
jgi:hypothetical protein